MSGARGGWGHGCAHPGTTLPSTAPRREAPLLQVQMLRGPAASTGPGKLARRLLVLL